METQAGKEFVREVIVQGSDDLIFWYVDGGAFVFRNDWQRNPEKLDERFIPNFPKEIPPWFEAVITNQTDTDAHFYVEGTREELEGLLRLSSGEIHGRKSGEPEARETKAEVEQ
jgi:hypothetical protein